MAVQQNYIAGEWSGGGAVNRNLNPSNTDDVVGEYARADRGDVERAIASAASAFAKWSLSTPQERFDVLDRIGTEILARKDEREEGKTLPEGIGEAARAGYIFKFFAGEALRLGGEKLASVRPGVEVEMTREPVGVVALITPWNFPIAIPAWKIAPALAYGNCVVFKPADLVPGSAWALAEVIARAGLPAGVFNLVMGSGAMIGDVLVNAPEISAISFTGSVDVGKRVAAAAIGHGTKVQLEMGGKNPLVVLDDAALPVAVNVAVQGAFYSTGQRCTASSRFIVERGIHDKFVGAVVDKIKSLKVDDALAAGTDIGPVVSQAQLDQDINLSQPQAARLLSGAGAVHRDE